MEAFVNSCIFIETFKEKGKEEASRIFEYLLKALFDLENVFFVNAIIYSEVVCKLVTKKKKKYNLKPNDALILATCKHYGIKYLISIDKNDFTIPCKKEGIILIDSVEKLKEVLNK